MTLPLTEIFETFGVSRQTLYRAMERADQASREALEPRKPGRRGKSEEQVKLEEATARAEALSKELSHWKTKYDVATTYLDLIRRWERGEDLEGDEEETSSPSKWGKKRQRRKQARSRTRRKKSGSTKKPSTDGEAVGVESTDDGGGHAHDG